MNKYAIIEFISANIIININDFIDLILQFNLFFILRFVFFGNFNLFLLF